MLSYHRNDAHGIGLKALKIRDDIAEIAVEADLNAVAQVFQIVAREAVDMVHREHREGRGTLAENINIFFVHDVANEGVGREHNAFFDPGRAGGEYYDRALVGIDFVVGEGRVFARRRIFFIDTGEEVLVREVDRMLYLRAVCHDLADILGKCAVIEHHVDIRAVEKLRRFFSGYIGRKRYNDAAAHEYSGDTGYVLIVRLADNGDMHAIFRYASDPAADRFAVRFDADIAALFDRAVSHEFYEYLFSILLRRSAYFPLQKGKSLDEFNL